MSPPQQPVYNFDDFKRACQLACESKERKQVYIWKDAVIDADIHFSLRTESAILDFIANDGLKECRFINQKPLGSSDQTDPDIVDAYEFKSGHKIGYIAFYRAKKTGNWIIKSFHPNQPINIIGDAFRIAGLIPSEDEEGE